MHFSFGILLISLSLFAIIKYLWRNEFFLCFCCCPVSFNAKTNRIQNERTSLMNKMENDLMIWKKKRMMHLMDSICFELLPSKCYQQILSNFHTLSTILCNLLDLSSNSIWNIFDVWLVTILMCIDYFFCITSQIMTVFLGVFFTQKNNWRQFRCLHFKVSGRINDGIIIGWFFILSDLMNEMLGMTSFFSF